MTVSGKKKKVISKKGIKISNRQKDRHFNIDTVLKFSNGTPLQPNTSLKVNKNIPFTYDPKKNRGRKREEGSLSH